MAYLLTSPYFTGNDDNGDPLNGGKVYTYAAGTTTPKASYSSSAASTPLANPVVLDSAGRAEIWLVGSYKIVVKDSSDTTIHTTDNITDPRATSEGSTVLGGFINKFRNPGFDVAQRGTSGSVTTGNTLTTLDGWYVGATGATVTWAQGYGTVSTFYGSYITLTGNSGMSDTFIKQRIESTVAAQLAGKVVTVQVNVNNSTGATITPTLTVKHPTAQDNWGATVTDVSAVSLSPIVDGANGTLAYTFTAAANTIYGLEVTLDFGAALDANTKSVTISRADIRVTPGVDSGINTSPDTPEFRPISSELIFCQRYFVGWRATDTTWLLGDGIAPSTTAVFLSLPLPVTMRTPPTGVTISNNAHITVTDGFSTAASSAVGVNSITSEKMLGLDITSSGLTQFRPYAAYINNASGYLLATGAEL